MTCWKKDKKWSDKYFPEIKRALGEYLICEPENFNEDRERNTDLTVFELQAVRIACRIRKDNYREKYCHEFTIRSDRPTGRETELAKIIRGWGNYLFYGFADESKLTQWFIGDLNAFRIWHSRELARNKGAPPGVAHNNFDGSSDFRSYEKGIIPGFIVAERGYDCPQTIIDGLKVAV